MSNFIFPYISRNALYRLWHLSYALDSMENKGRMKRATHEYPWQIGTFLAFPLLLDALPNSRKGQFCAHDDLGKKYIYVYLQETSKARVEAFF